MVVPPSGIVARPGSDGVCSSLPDAAGNSIALLPARPRGWRSSGFVRAAEQAGSTTRKAFAAVRAASEIALPVWPSVIPLRSSAQRVRPSRLGA
jgi:hypothetical protein